MGTFSRLSWQSSVLDTKICLSMQFHSIIVVLKELAHELRTLDIPFHSTDVSKSPISGFDLVSKETFIHLGIT